MTIEVAEKLIREQAWGSRQSDIRIIESNPNGAALVGYTNHFPGLDGRPRAERRVAFFNADAEKQWDFIAE